ncbi:hypothetical protein A2U01_0030644, partial [Trifolium medium]|nr:hypothetical protein [Trifolium medium]
VLVMKLEKMNKLFEVAADKQMEENKDWMMKMKLNNVGVVVGGRNDCARQCVMGDEDGVSEGGV